MASIIQVFGTKKCHDTQKALRFFKERNIKIQFVDLSEKAISKGEFDSICRNIKMEDLINKKSAEYKKRNLEYISHDLEEELLNNPLLFTTPIVRHGQKAALGNKPDVWTAYSKDTK